MIRVSHAGRLCMHVGVCVCFYSVRCEADLRPDCHGFALPVQHHSNVVFGHEIFSTVFPIPSYSKKDSCRYWQNLTLGNFEDLTIRQLADGSI